MEEKVAIRVFQALRRGVFKVALLCIRRVTQYTVIPVLVTGIQPREVCRVKEPVRHDAALLDPCNDGDESRVNIPSFQARLGKKLERPGAMRQRLGIAWLPAVLFSALISPNVVS
jgi:hypothetical protein